MIQTIDISSGLLSDFSQSWEDTWDHFKKDSYVNKTRIKQILGFFSFEDSADNIPYNWLVVFWLVVVSVMWVVVSVYV